jgi:hypothetical protein
MRNLTTVYAMFTENTAYVNTLDSWERGDATPMKQASCASY